MNTKLYLMYRDASNYKTGFSLVLAGAITDQQIAAIAPKLQDGMFVIAEEVGLPTPSFAFRGKDGWPNEDIDHVFTTLADFEDALGEENGLPTAAEMLTDDAPTCGMTIADLVGRILAVENWNVSLEWERMAAAT